VVILPGATAWTFAVRQPDHGRFLADHRGEDLQVAELAREQSTDGTCATLPSGLPGVRPR